MADNTARKHPAKHLEAYRFKPGQSANPRGRPKGARSKISERFLADVLEVWNEKGKAAVEATARDHPEKFLSIVASILPKELDIDDRRDPEHIEGALPAVTRFLERFASNVKDDCAGEC